MATLEITTVLGCPLDCSFCPQDTLQSAYSKGLSSETSGRQPRLLTVDVFKECISKLPDNVHINFAGYSEPFANPDCFEMVMHAISLQREVYIYSTLQGLKPEQATQLLDHYQSGRISRVCIHLPDDGGNMPGFRLTDNYLECLRVFSAGTSVQFMCMSSSGQLDTSLQNILQQTSWGRSVLSRVPKQRFIGMRRAGSLDASRVESSGQLQAPVSWAEPITCRSTPYYDDNVLLPNGDVYLCCMDYGLTTKLGSLLDSSYESLFASSAFLSLMQANRSEVTSGSTVSTSICRSCENVTCYSSSRGWNSQPLQPLPTYVPFSYWINRSPVRLRLVRTVKRILSGTL